MNRVLVVDDEPLIVRALTISLRARKYEVDTAYDGATALRLAAERRPDVVVLDLGLAGQPSPATTRGGSSLSDTGAGADSTIWGVNAANQIYHYTGDLPG